MDCWRSNGNWDVGGELGLFGLVWRLQWWIGDILRLVDGNRLDRWRHHASCRLRLSEWSILNLRSWGYLRTPLSGSVSVWRGVRCIGMGLNVVRRCPPW